MEEIIIIIICLTLNALLAAVEMAFVTVRKQKLRELAKTGDARAIKLLSLRERPERTLSVIQIGITLVGAIAAAVGGAGAEESIAPILESSLSLSENTAEIVSVFLVVLPITYLSVVVGELVPKALALRNPSGIAIRAVSPLEFFDRFLTPVVNVLEWSTKKVLHVFFKRNQEETAAAENADPMDIDQLSNQAQEYFLNLVSLEKKRVKDVFLPWTGVVHVEIGQSLADVEAIILSSGHTRLPVLREGEVIGTINTKEFMAFRKMNQEDWSVILRPEVRVQKSASLISALRQMQEKRIHLSIVYSQNQRVGIVTIEDILEEVIGDVFDEDDDGAIRRILSLGSRFRGSGTPREP